VTLKPLYLKNLSLLKETYEDLYSGLSDCNLCPRECGVDRTKGEIGFCKAPLDVVVDAVTPHFGEEPPLVGYGGSGTIFFSHCNLRCVFCQNYPISHLGEGEVWTPHQLCHAMLWLQEKGCHNINLVTPTHYLPQILKSLYMAAERGLFVPIVYNCGGYESLWVIQRLRGLVDIYMPDLKMKDSGITKELLSAPDYFPVAIKAIKEMASQVGNYLEIKDRAAIKGLLIRHLVMPGMAEDGCQVMEAIAKEIGVGTTVNVMAQYRPMYRAKGFPLIARRPYLDEVEKVKECARSLGLSLI
jgi:putative pyruvate formate lyase activating enzyme